MCTMRYTVLWDVGCCLHTKHPLFQKLENNTKRHLKSNDWACLACIKVHILRTEEGRLTRNSCNHFPELFQGQNYFWTEIITNPVSKKQLNNTKKEMHGGGGGQPVALGSHYPLVLHHNCWGLVLKEWRTQSTEPHFMSICRSLHQITKFTVGGK